MKEMATRYRLNWNAIVWASKGESPSVYRSIGGVVVR